MTTPTKTPAGTATPTADNASLALTRREEDIKASRERVAARAGVSPEQVTQALAQRKNQHLIAAKMSEMNWGQGLDEMTRRAVAAYLERHHLDVTEIDILGGNLYRNSRYYKRRLGELVEDGLVEYTKSDWVQMDHRLEAMAKDNALDAEDRDWAARESARRTRIRIEYGIPDKAVGACVFRIKLRSLNEEMTAAKWAGGGTQKKADPVGDAFPMESSESRACRRAMLLCSSSIPSLKWQEDEATDDGLELSKVVGEARQALKAADDVTPRVPLMQLPDGDPYAVKTNDLDDDLAFDAEIAKRDEA